jgi:hypothetical protein
MTKQNKTFYQKAKSWAARHKLHGHSAFSRYVMMTFVDRLNQVSDEFIFKGSNLLWIYIKTPRSTPDIGKPYYQIKTNLNTIALYSASHPSTNSLE